MPLSQLECFKATIAHQKHDGFLFYALFTPDLERRVRESEGLGANDDLMEHFGMMDRVDVAMQPPKGYRPPDYWAYYSDIDVPANAFVNHLGVLEVPGSMYHFTGYVSPLRNAKRLEDLESFPYPNVRGFSEDGMRERVDDLHARGRVAFSIMAHTYEDSWQIRGYEPFLMDMIERPEWCEYILDRIKERNLMKACAAARAGVDVLITGDDVANQRGLMFSKETWRKFIKCRWAEVYAAAKAINPDIQIWYHSDGTISEIIPELIEIGVDILNPVQPECVDPVELKKKYGDRLVFDGTIGTQTTMPFGTPDDVRQVVRERVWTLGGDGALVLSPTHVLEPEVPLENIRALIETVREFGELA